MNSHADDRRFLNFSRVFFLLAAVLAAGASPVAAQVSNAFDAGLEGWRVTGDNSAAWESDTGNPGGCLSVNDHATGAMNYVIAPARYHGDWSGMTAADTLSADIWLHNRGGSIINPAYIFRIAGPGGSAHALSGGDYFPPDSVWRTYSVPLDPAAWTIESGTWAQIVQSVTSLRVMGEFITGNETCRLDNVHLSATPGDVFEPCLCDGFNESDTGDWSSEDTGGLSRESIGGNPGGYLRVGDKGGVTSIVLAPATFLGDWSPLKGSGFVGVDVRVLSRSGQAFRDMEFIRISGPGGSAYVTLDAATLPPSSLMWRTFRFPLNASVWTVDSGDWDSLLAEVTECAIIAEFFDGSEIIGLDNFGRYAGDCTPCGETIQVHGPSLEPGGYTSFVSISSVAFNRRDGQLYGLVREGAEGLYPVTGPQQGIRLQAYTTPAHLVFDAAGNAYISEDYSGRLFRYTSQGESSVWISEFGSSSDDDPYGMTIAPAGFSGENVTGGDILVADRGNSGDDIIWAVSPAVADEARALVPDPGSLNVEYFDLAADPDGTVYVADTQDQDHVFALNPAGVLTALPLSQPVSSIHSIVCDFVEGALYIASNSARAVYRVDAGSGAVELVADGFVDFHACSLEIDPILRRLWVVDAGTGRVYDFTLPGGAALDVAVDLEGDSRPDPAGWQAPLHVQLFEPGADVLADCPLSQTTVQADKVLDAALARMPAVAPGEYDIAVRSDTTLLNVKRGVTVAGPETAVSLGLLREGNAEPDDRIDLADFARLAAAWTALDAEANYDPQADFDRTGEAAWSDLVLLISNWLTQSPIETP